MPSNLIVSDVSKRLHDRTTRILLLRLRIEHFRLRAQAVGLGHQTVNLLTTL